MSVAHIRGQDLWYEESGGGDAVLMLHGFTGTGRAHLGPQIDFFAQYYRVIAPDLRGYGRSEPKPRPFGADFYRQDALDAAALLDALGIETAHVLGYSDGAESAVLLAEERPDLARSVVVWGVTGVFDQEIERSARGFLPVEDWATRRPEWRQEIINLHGLESLAPIIEGWSAAILAILAAGGDVSLARAGSIRCPMLLINGEHDAGNPPHLARQLVARIPDCTFEIWPGLGHPVHREASDQLNQRALAFLNQCA